MDSLGASGASQKHRLGNWVRLRREALKLSQKELAQLAGISGKTLWNLENEHKASKKTLIALANHLQLKASQLSQYIENGRKGLAPTGIPASLGSETRTNLPEESRSVLGRDDQVESIRHHIWKGDERLVTLVGPFGVGKTTLAQRVARKLLVDFPDGVFFVSLDWARNDDDVVHAILRALGVDVPEDSRRTPLMRLKDSLRDQRRLLVLDNLEQAAGVGRLLETLINTEGMLTIIATSREPLNITDEAVRYVRPLEMPADPARITLRDVGKYPAVKLFAERAGRPVVIDDNSARLAALICKRLDGLPLAIELAAPMASHMPLDHLLAGMDERLDLLKGGPTDLPERQQSLQAAIEWSYVLLSDLDRSTFRRFAVFQGGCSWEAAEVVCGQGGVSGTDIRRSLLALIDKNLLNTQRQPGVDIRLNMLETLHEYANEQLRSEGEDGKESEYSATLCEHTAYYIRLVRTYADDLASLQADIDNVSVALTALLQSAQYQSFVETVRTFYRVLDRAGRYREEEALLTQAVQAARKLGDDRALAATQLYRAGVLEKLGRTGESEQVAEEARRLAESSGDTQTHMGALSELGILSHRHNRMDRAKHYFRQALQMARDTGQERAIAVYLTNLGRVEDETGNFDKAMSLYNESLPIALSLGDDEAASYTLLLKAALSFAMGQYGDAEKNSQDGLKKARTAHSTQRIIGHLQNLAALAYVRGDYEQSRHYFEEALDLAETACYVEGSLHSLTELGEVINRTDPVAAEVTLLRAERLARASGYTPYLCPIHANLGRALLSQGEMARSRQRLGQALREAYEMRSPWFRAVVSNLIGEWYLKEGHSLGKAHRWFDKVRVLSESTDMSEHKAAALYGLARVTAQQGNLSAAHAHAQESLRLYADLRHVMAAEVQRWLAAFSAEPHLPV